MHLVHESTIHYRRNPALSETLSTMTVSEYDLLRQRLTVSENEPLAPRVSEIDCLVISCTRDRRESQKSVVSACETPLKTSSRQSTQLAVLSGPRQMNPVYSPSHVPLYKKLQYSQLGIGVKSCRMKYRIYTHFTIHALFHIED